MALKDYVRSFLAELSGLLPFDRRRKDKADRGSAPRTNPSDEPDREEVQYPGYFEGKGRL